MQSDKREKLGCGPTLSLSYIQHLNNLRLYKIPSEFIYLHYIKGMDHEKVHSNYSSTSIFINSVIINSYGKQLILFFSTTITYYYDKMKKRKGRYTPFSLLFNLCNKFQRIITSYKGCSIITASFNGFNVNNLDIVLK